jgi:Ca2+-binding RTX toxin-like protein
LTTNTYYESVIQMDPSLTSNDTAWSLNGNNTSLTNGLFTPSYGGISIPNTYAYNNILVSQIQIGLNTANEITSSFLVYTNTGGQKASVTQLQGTTGNDVLSWDSTQAQITALKGGLGFDTLYLPTGNLNESLATKPLTLSGIDQIDMRQSISVPNQLTLTQAELLQADGKTLVVRGDGLDNVQYSPTQSLTRVLDSGVSVTVNGKNYSTDAQGQIDLASGGNDKFLVYQVQTTSGTASLLVSDQVPALSGAITNGTELPKFTLVSGATSGANTLTGTSGNDLLMGGQGDDTLTGGAAADIFRFIANETGSDTITDFSKSQGDKLDLSQLLSGKGMNASLSASVSQYLSLSQVGTTANAVLKVDVDGVGGFGSPDMSITLNSAWTTDNLGASAADATARLMTLINDRVIAV